MHTRTRLLLAAGAVVILSGAAGLWMRQGRQPASAPQTNQSSLTLPAPSPALTEQALRSAGLAIEDLSVVAAGEILVLRGKAQDAQTVARAEEVARARGAARVANMIQVKQRRDDDAIRREVERELAANPSLGDCKLAVAVEDGVVRVSGILRSDIQGDVVRTSLRRIDGAQRVETSFTKF
jgi:osmotically-inducible protein OsmY